MSLLSYDEELQAWDQYGTVTVNITQLPFLYSAIDTNNNGEQIIAFLEENGFGHATGHMLQSGFCTYPVFRFDEDMLIRIDPEVFSTYGSLHGQSHIALSERITKAHTQANAISIHNNEKSHEYQSQTSHIPSQEK